MSIQSSPIVHALPYPVLEAGNLSFPEGNYEPIVKMCEDGCSVEITHQISGAPFIEKLIDKGLVEYCCLFSVPKSGIRRLYKTEVTGKIEWVDTIVGESPKLRPILIYTGEDKKIKFTKECGVAELWLGKTITLPKGARLARGKFLNVNSSECQFLRFAKIPELPRGTFNVEANTEDGFYFMVKSSPDVFHFVQRPEMESALRSGLLTAVVAQCFSILKIDYNESDDNSIESFPNLKILSSKLMAEYGYDWNDEEFDPMLAATNLYPFQVPYSVEEDD
jgi:hypothetical protein